MKSSLESIHGEHVRLDMSLFGSSSQKPLVFQGSWPGMHMLAKLAQMIKDAAQNVPEIRERLHHMPRVKLAIKRGRRQFFIVLFFCVMFVFVCGCLFVAAPGQRMASASGKCVDRRRR